MSGWLLPPKFEDEERTRIARTLNTVVWLLIPGTVLSTVSSIFVQPRAQWLYESFAALVLLLLVAQRLMHRGRVSAAAYLTLLSLWVVITESVALDGMSSPAVPSYMALAIMAGALAGGSGVIWSSVFSVGGILSIYALESAGYLHPDADALDPQGRAITYCLSLTVVGAMIWLLSGERERVHARLRERGEALASTNAMLQQRHAERTALAEIGRVALTTEELQDVFDFAVELTGKSLGLEACLVIPLDDRTDATPTEDPMPQSRWGLDPPSARRVRAAFDRAPGPPSKAVSIALSETDRAPARDACVVAFRPEGTLASMLVAVHGPNGTPHDERAEFLVGVARVLGEAVERRRSERRREQLQNQLFQAQKLESIGRLAGGVAHDLNNMLMAISGNAELLVHSEAEPAPVELTEIVAAAERASALTRQLLQFSRKELTRPRDLSLGSTVLGLQRMLRRLIGEQYDLDVTEHSEAWVRADKGQLEQVVLNLVMNARDAMPGGGLVSIVVRRLRERASLEVRDQGHGIEASVKDRIFEPFFTTKRPGEGTGLGLAVVHGIVEHSGGTVTVLGNQPRGTVFRVELPAVNPSAEAPAPPADDREPSTGSGVILLVEDEELVRSVTRRTLERAGYDVLTAENAEVALGIDLGTRTIDLLLSDVVLGGKTGPELAAELSTRWPGLRVLLMSGYTGSSIAAHSSGWELLSKPLSPDRLLARVRATLHSPPSANVASPSAPQGPAEVSTSDGTRPPEVTGSDRRRW